MSNLQEKLYDKSPNFIQNLIVTVYNILAYKKRYSKKYYKFLSHYSLNKNLTHNQLKQVQETKYADFINYTKSNSPYYKKILSQIDNPHKIPNLKKIPIITKETLRKNISDIYTIGKSEGLVSKTGGTTGKSLEVLYTQDDIQERFAILDNFRNNFGYKLGKKTAWFSGKNLLTKNDINKNRFWKTDYLYKVRYYSTYHIHDQYLEHYIQDLIKFQPEYMVGFPSTMYEIAKYGIFKKINFPENTIKAIFPTAETVTSEMREVLETFFKTNLYNQYASSEGAPFIIECENKKLHLELQSGIFEVLNEDNEESESGRLIITSFNSHGTPLIRYDIGDQIELDPTNTCDCGNNNPLVKRILGRISDYIFSEETGKINLGNISNCTKGVNGIIRFQIIQDQVSEIKVLIVKDNTIYNEKYENIFLDNLKHRLGSKMKIDIEYVNNISVEKSGKYRLVKNNLKTVQK